MAYQGNVHRLRDEAPGQPGSNNERILALLDQWMQEPDDLGAEWWASFDEELRANRSRSPRQELP
jgi:hypothetical protein